MEQTQNQLLMILGLLSKSNFLFQITGKKHLSNLANTKENPIKNAVPRVGRCAGLIKLKKEGKMIKFKTCTWRYVWGFTQNPNSTVKHIKHWAFFTESSPTHRPRGPCNFDRFGGGGGMSGPEKSSWKLKARPLKPALTPRAPAQLRDRKALVWSAYLRVFWIDSVCTNCDPGTGCVC